MEREEDRLLCSGAEEMPGGGAVARWRGRRGEERSTAESEVAVVELVRGIMVR